MDHFWQDVKGFFNFPELYSAIVRWAQDGDRFVEVGCYLGQSAAYMIVEIENSGKKISFDVVDTFKGNPGVDFMLKLAEQQGGSFRHVFEETMRKYGVLDRVGIYEMLSTDAAECFDDESLAFVFIDGNHEYDYVLADLRAWWSKVKVGGVIAGHDYYDKNPLLGGCMVKSAVDGFFGIKDRSAEIKKLLGLDLRGRRLGQCWVEPRVI